MSNPTISVLMIVKNEEELLERALKSTIGADNWFILDTGSQDRTIEIAEKFGATVFKDWIWTDSFCDAQNHLLKKVRDRVGIDTDWIISLDADEQLLTPMSVVRQAISKARDVVRVKMVAEGDAPNTFYFGRIFRNTPSIYWVASIHKHLNVPGEGEQVGDVSIMYGWSPAHKLDPDRSLRMLEAAVERGEGLPRNLYYLAREYWYKERFQDCIDTVKKYEPLSHWDAELSESLFMQAQAYEKLQKAEECLIACSKAIAVNSNFKEAIIYMSSIVLEHNKLQWLRMARTANNEGVLWKRTEVEPVMDAILIEPHQDDAVMFAAYTLMRVKPLVISVTSSHIQPNRGDEGCDARTRNQENIDAIHFLGCPVVFMDIPDNQLTKEILRERLKGISAHKVYIPAYHENGNLQHNLINEVCLELFSKDQIEQYCTYSKDDLMISGGFEVTPTKQEMERKNVALDFYKSQINLPSMSEHFKYVRNKSEYLM